MNRKPLADLDKTAWLRLAGTTVSLGLLVLLLSQQGWEDIAMAVYQVSPWRLALALGLTLLSRLAVVGRWHTLLRAAGLPISFSQSNRLTFAGLFASNFLPTTIGGDVVRLAGALQMRFNTAICAASLVVDRVVGMTGMAMALPFGVARFAAWGAFASLASDAQRAARPLFPWHFLILSPLSGWLETARRKGRRLAKNLVQAISNWAGRPGSLLIALAFSWAHMACLFGSIALLLDGMGEPLSFWIIAGLWSAVYFITLAPVSINGYGVQEISMALIFSRLGSISQESSLSAALLIRTLTMVASLPGAVYLPGIATGKRPKSKSGEPGIESTIPGSPQEGTPHGKP